MYSSTHILDIGTLSGQISNQLQISTVGRIKEGRFLVVICLLEEFSLVHAGLDCDLMQDHVGLSLPYPGSHEAGTRAEFVLKKRGIEQNENMIFALLYTNENLVYSNRQIHSLSNLALR